MTFFLEGNGHLSFFFFFYLIIYFYFIIYKGEWEIVYFKINCLNERPKESTKTFKEKIKEFMAYLIFF